MKITNNTKQTIQLVNGKKLTKFKTISIEKPSEELLSQVENLKKLGLITVA